MSKQEMYTARAEDLGKVRKALADYLVKLIAKETSGEAIHHLASALKEVAEIEGEAIKAANPSQVKVY